MFAAMGAALVAGIVAGAYGHKKAQDARAWLYRKLRPRRICRRAR